MPYRELEDFGSFFQLMQLVFPGSFSLDPKKLKRWIMLDPRLRDTPIGFCAIEGERIVGFVGVMDLAARTLDEGTELAGGIWGVATVPSYAEKGIATSLFEKAHEHLESRKYRFSFLTTNRTTIAHAFYRKLGYGDVVEYPCVCKLLWKKSTKTKGEEWGAGLGTHEVDWKKIAAIYNSFSQGKAGFVVRNERYYDELLKCGRLGTERVLSNNHGFVIFKKEGRFVNIREIIAPKADDLKELIQQVERMPIAVVYDRSVLDKEILRNYRSMGYEAQGNSYEILMAKPLKTNISFEQLYGRSFYMTSYDNIVIP